MTVTREGLNVPAAMPARPLVLFFLLAFALAWGLMGLFIAQHLDWLGAELPLTPLLLIGSWTPNIAAFLVVGLVIRRRGGIQELLRGWLKYRVAPGWYVVALSPVLLALAVFAVHRLATGSVPATDVTRDPAAIGGLLLIALVTGAMGEELGWRGFALPWLQTRMSALGAGLLLGVIWELWHAPLWFAGLGYEEMPFLTMAMIGISFSVLAVWLCNHTRGSMLLVTLFHLFLNVSVNIVEATALSSLAVLFTVFAVTVVAWYGPSRLSRREVLPIDMVTKGWES